METQGVTSLGQGYKSLYSSAMPTQVKIMSQDPVAATSHVNVHICSSVDQLYKHLEISAAAAASTTWGSVKTRVDFVKEVQSTSMSITVLVVAEKISSGGNATSSEFVKTPTNASSLYKHGGDSYVSSIQLGGSYLAAYTYTIFDEKTFQSVQAECDTSFTGLGASVTADFSTKIADIAKKTKTTTSFRAAAYGFTGAWPTEPEGLHDFCTNWNARPMDQPMTMKFGVSPYSQLDGCPDDFDVIDDYVATWRGDGDIASHASLADVVKQIHKNQMVLSEVADMYRFYGCDSVDPRFSTAATAYQNLLESISQWRKDVNHDPTKAKIATPVINNADLQFPVAKWTLTTNFGGPQTESASSYMEDITDVMIPRHVRPTAITAKIGDSVDSITRSYQMMLGEDKNTFDKQQGGSGGHTGQSINFGPGEFVTSISSRWWDTKMVKAVGVSTALQSVVIGRQDAPSHDWAMWTRPATSAPQNQCYVGMAVFAGDYVEGIKMQYVLFEPCVWQDPKMTAA